VLALLANRDERVTALTERADALTALAKENAGIALSLIRK